MELADKSPAQAGWKCAGPHGGDVPGTAGCRGNGCGFSSYLKPFFFGGKQRDFREVCSEDGDTKTLQGETCGGAGTVGRIPAGDASDPVKMICVWLPVKPGQREGPPAVAAGQLHPGRAVTVTGGG